MHCNPAGNVSITTASNSVYIVILKAFNSGSYGCIIQSFLYQNIKCEDEEVFKYLSIVTMDTLKDVCDGLRTCPGCILYELEICIDRPHNNIGY